MKSQLFFPFHPEKIFRNGLFILGGSAILAASGAFCLWSALFSPSSPTLFALSAKKLSSSQEASPLSFSLDLPRGGPSVPLPNVEGEMTFSFDPPRPDAITGQLPLFVRLRKSAQSKRVSLPSRIDLLYEKGCLSFSETSCPFWMELKSLAANQIEGRVFVSTAQDSRVETQTFVATAQQSPVQSAQEFADGSPFRNLAEARWWGHDLFREKYGSEAMSERLEIGPPSSADFLELKGGDWIVWREGHWRKVESLQEGPGGLERAEKQISPIAHIVSREARSILLEGWDQIGHVRLLLPLAQPPNWKAKGEEIFSSVRVRSEKQISCMLEKQCLILKVGDWVFKGDKRWKILRKKEEKDAYLNGKWVGELFVFDRIEMKGGQKVVQGHLFNSGRSQVAPLEIAVHAQKKGPQAQDSFWFRKAKGKGK